MEIISARDFRTNQTAILTKALNGESVLLTSRIGTFKITPVTEEDKLTTHICSGLKEMKQIISGELPARSAKDFINEL